MTHSSHSAASPHSPIPVEEIDRLVDGELDEEARSRLLRQIDSQDQWRPLAIAFLEAQALRRAMETLCAERPQQTVPPHGEPVVQTHRSDNWFAKTSPRFWRTRAATIALLILIVVSVALLRERWSANRPKGEIVNWTFRPPINSVNPPSFTRNPGDEPLPKSVKFVVNDGLSDLPQMIELPLTDSTDSLSQNWSAEQWQTRSALPSDVREWLDAAGYDIEEQSGLWPVMLPNGRQVVFPVNQVHVNNRRPTWHQ